jgi:hypothetical protein
MSGKYKFKNSTATYFVRLRRVVGEVIGAKSCRKKANNNQIKI